MNLDDTDLDELIQAERAILGAVFRHGIDVLPREQNPGPAMMTDPDHRAIFAAQLAAMRGKEVLDRVMSVARALEKTDQLHTIGGRDYLNDLANCSPLPSDVPELVTRLIEIQGLDELRPVDSLSDDRKPPNRHTRERQPGKRGTPMVGVEHPVQQEVPATDPSTLARIFADDLSDWTEIQALQWWRQDWYGFNGQTWALISRDRMRALVSAFITTVYTVSEKGKETRISATSGRVRDVQARLQDMHLLEGDEPRVIDGAQLPEPLASMDTRALGCKVLVCANGVLIFDSRRFVPSSPALFSVTPSPVAYDADATEPRRWLAFLESLWSDDVQSIECLQEIIGYLVTRDTSQEKIFLVYGPPRSGKGTIARVVRGIVGADNVCSPTLSSLAGDFGVQPLLGRSVAIIPDARLGKRSDRMSIVETLLSVSGQDTQTVNRKHREVITTRLPTRFVIMTNEIPRLDDASGALMSRFIVLPMTESFLGKEDHGLSAQLAVELPGILLWALDGLARLRERGRFEQPESADGLLRDVEAQIAPIKAFLRERCEIGREYSVHCDKLARAWRAWSSDRGIESSTSQAFGRQLRAACPGLKNTRPRIGGTRVRAYQGIRLRDDQ